MIKLFIGSPGFWAITGVIISSVSSLLIWIIQKTIERNIDIKNIRCEKINDVCRLCNLVQEKMKIIHQNVVLNDIVAFWLANPQFWTDVELFKIRFVILAFFKKSIKEYDNYQLGIAEYINYNKKIMEEKQFNHNHILALYQDVVLRQNKLLNKISKIYF